VKSPLQHANVIIFLFTAEYPVETLEITWNSKGGGLFH